MLIHILDTVIRADQIALMTIDRNDPLCLALQLSCCEENWEIGPFPTAEDAVRALLEAVKKWKEAITR
jgi:hypothetical protein